MFRGERRGDNVMPHCHKTRERKDQGDGPCIAIEFRVNNATYPAKWAAPAS